MVIGSWVFDRSAMGFSWVKVNVHNTLLLVTLSLYNIYNSRLCDVFQKYADLGIITRFITKVLFYRDAFL